MGTVRGFSRQPDHVAVRVVDENGKTLGPGSMGEIVISNLTNRATVLLNYKLGDVVPLGRSACHCGCTLPTIDVIEGRADDLIVQRWSCWKICEPFQTLSRCN